MSNKKLRDELKGPDEFEATMGQGVGWLTQHSKTILGLLVVAVVASLVTIGWSFYQRKIDKTAADDFQTMITSMTAPEAKMDDSKLKELDSFITKHPSSSFVSSALLLKGKVLLSLGKFSEAQETYQKATSKLVEPFSSLAMEGEANAFMEQKKWPEAELLWKKLATNKKNPLQAYHLWKLGMTQEAAGKAPEAIQTYKSFETDFQGSPILEKVRGRQAALLHASK